MANSIELTTAAITATSNTPAFLVGADENFDIVASVVTAITGGSYTLQLEAKVILTDLTVLWVAFGAAATLDSADSDNSIQLTLLAKDRTGDEFRVNVVEASATHSGTIGIRLVKSSNL